MVDELFAQWGGFGVKLRPAASEVDLADRTTVPNKIGVGGPVFSSGPPPSEPDGGFPASGSPVSGLLSETGSLSPWLWSL